MGQVESSKTASANGQGSCNIQTQQSLGEGMRLDSCSDTSETPTDAAICSDLGYILVQRASGEEVQINASGLLHIRDLKVRIAGNLQIPRFCVELIAGESRLQDNEELPIATPPKRRMVTLMVSAQQAHNQLQTAGIPLADRLAAVEAIRYTAHMHDDIAFQSLRKCLEDRQECLDVHSAAMGALADLAVHGHCEAATLIHFSLASLSESLENRADDARIADVERFVAFAPWDWKDAGLAKDVYGAFASDDDIGVRQAAIRVLAKVATIYDDNTMSILRRKLECKTEDTLVRRMAAGALHRVARGGHSGAIAAVEACMHDPDVLIRDMAHKFIKSQR